MDELKQSYIELRRDAKESIADAFGIPSAMFMSDNAYASEMDMLRRQWYTASRFVGLYQTIEEVMTDQLLKAYGYKMRFNLEALDIFKEDESAKAASLGTLVSAITTDPEVAEFGMGILGYDLDKAQQGQLDEIKRKKEEDRKAVQENMKQPTDAPQDKPQDKPVETPPEDEEDKQEEEAPAKSIALSVDEIKDLALWYDRARQWYVKGKGTAVDWECKHLPESIAAPIRLKLANAKTEEDITQAFTLGETTVTPAPEYDAVRELAISIDKAVEALKE